jgi:hypothetical protein
MAIVSTFTKAGILRPFTAESTDYELYKSVAGTAELKQPGTETG